MLQRSLHLGDLIGLLLVVLVFVFIAAGVHYFIHRRILAILVSTILVPFLLLVLNLLIYGLSDPFIFVAMIFSAIKMFFISCFVSIPFHRHRQSKEQEQ